MGQLPAVISKHTLNGNAKPIQSIKCLIYIASYQCHSGFIICTTPELPTHDTKTLHDHVICTILF